MCSNALLKNTVITLLNTHRSYTEKMKAFKSFWNIVMESALWIFRGSSCHNLAAEVPKRRFPNRMDLLLYSTSDVNAVSERYLLMLFIFLMCMLTDRQMLVICFWRVILLSNVTPSILTYLLTFILSLPTTRHWLSPRLFFVLKITNSVLFSMSVNALRRIAVVGFKYCRNRFYLKY